jgi:pyruvate kinase
LRRVAGLLDPAATVAYTASGFSALRASRERPSTPILALTPQLETARRLALAWGVRPVHFPEQLHESSEMIERATAAARQAGLAGTGDTLIVIAGLPFGCSGSTNLLHIAQIA